MTITEELFDQVEELNTSLRELTDYELVDCRQALINRTNILMGLLNELDQEDPPYVDAYGTLRNV